MTRYSTTMSEILAKVRGEVKEEKDMSEMCCKECGDEFGKPVSESCTYDAYDPMGENWIKKENYKESLDEGKSSTGYELYHKDFSSAMQHAYDFAKKKFKITVKPEEIDNKVASGPRKPSKGKTNSYRLEGDKGAIHVQVYGMDNGKYELNMYKEEVEMTEGAFGELQIAAKDLAKYASKDKKGMDYKDFMKAAAMMKTGKVKELAKFTMDLDTEPRDHIIMMVKDAIGKSAAEKLFNVSIREEDELEERWEVSAGDHAIGSLSYDDKEIVKVDKKTAAKLQAYFKKTNDGKAWRELFQGKGKGKDSVENQKDFDAYVKRLVGEEVELEEKLKVSDGLGAWIDDFKKSDAPQFKGKSDEEKKNMAIAAFTDAGGKLESVEEALDPKKVVDYLVKKGNNPKDAQKMVDKQFAYVTKTYKNVSVAKAAEIISSLKEEGEPEKPDSAKAVEQGREDKKKTRIAQLQLQIAKAQETINKLNAQEKPSE